MRMTGVLLVCMSAFLLAGTIHAEMVIAPSIDWLVAQADVICLGQVESVETKALDTRLWVEKVRVKVTHSVQNCRTGETIAFAYQVSDDAIPSKKWLFSKGGVLVLLRHTELSERDLDASLTPVSLSRPLTVIDLSGDTDKGFYTHDFRKLTSGSAIKDEILAARSRLIEYRKSTPGAKVEASRLSVPVASAIYKELYADSSVELTVPEYLMKKKE